MDVQGESRSSSSSAPLSSGEPGGDVNTSPSSTPFPITFLREPYTDHLADEMAPLLVENWRETGADLDVPLKPLWHRYQQAAEAGFLRIFTVRLGALLVGYAIYQVMLHSHRGESLEASNDVIWLSPRLRGRFIGYRFIKWHVALMKAEGVKKARLSVKLDHNWGRLLERLGFKAMEVTYAMRLDG
jgi:GNAT superfamily N-acetyltransferase